MTEAAEFPMLMETREGAFKTREGALKTAEEVHKRFELVSEEFKLMDSEARAFNKIIQGVVEMVLEMTEDES